MGVSEQALDPLGTGRQVPGVSACIVREAADLKKRSSWLSWAGTAQTFSFRPSTHEGTIRSSRAIFRPWSILFTSCSGAGSRDSPPMIFPETPVVWGLWCGRLGLGLDKSPCYPEPRVGVVVGGGLGFIFV